MSRAYVVYILMFLLAGGGLWVILIFGRAVNAPDDVSGAWTIEWETPAPPGAAPAGEAPTMRVAQSGRYFNVQFGQARPLKMTLEENWTGKRSGRQLKMHLRGQAWKLDLHGDIPSGERFRVPALRVELDGPTRHVGIARRQREQTAEATTPGDAAGKTIPHHAPTPASTRPVVPEDAPPATPDTSPAAAISTSAATETAHAR